MTKFPNTDAIGTNICTGWMLAEFVSRLSCIHVLGKREVAVLEIGGRISISWVRGTFWLRLVLVMIMKIDHYVYAPSMCGFNRTFSCHTFFRRSVGNIVTTVVLRLFVYYYYYLYYAVSRRTRPFRARLYRMDRSESPTCVHCTSDNGLIKVMIKILWQLQRDLRWWWCVSHVLLYTEDGTMRGEISGVVGRYNRDNAAKGRPLVTSVASYVEGIIPGHKNKIEQQIAARASTPS